MTQSLILFGAAALALIGAPAMAAPVGDSDKISLEQLAAANDAAWGAKDVATMTEQYTVSFYRIRNPYP